MVIYWYLSPAMYIPHNPRKKPGKVYRPLHPWGVEIVNKMVDYLPKHRGQNVDAVLFYSESEVSVPAWVETVLSHNSLQPMLASAEKEVLSTPEAVRDSVRKFHEHSGNTVLVIATNKFDLIRIRSGFGASKIELYLNLITNGGGGVRQTSHESKNLPESWDTI